MATLDPLDHVDKENLLVIAPGEKSFQDRVVRCPTPLRTPLQDVNQSSVNRNSRRAYYSQITPASTGKTQCLQRSFKLQPSVLVYHDDEEIQDKSDTNVGINTLVYKKVVELIKKAQEEFDLKLAERDKLIDLLRKNTGENNESSDEWTPTPFSDEDISGFVDSLLQKCLGEVQSMRMAVPELNLLPPSTPLKPDAAELHSELNCLNCTQFGITEYSKPVSCTQIGHGEKLTTSRSVPSVNTSINSDLTAEEPLGDLTRTSNNIMALDCSLTPNCTSQFDPVLTASVDCSSSQSDSSTELSTVSDNAHLKNSASLPTMRTVSCSPVQVFSRDCGIQVCPLLTSSQSSPVSSIVNSKDCETMTDRDLAAVLMHDLGIQVQPQCCSVSCSPRKQFSVCVSPEKKDASTQVFREYHSAGCSPLRLGVTDSETMTEVSPVGHMSTSTDNNTPVKLNVSVQNGPDLISTLTSPILLSCVEKGVMTDSLVVSFVSVATETEHSAMVDRVTSMTPVKALNKQGRRLSAEEVRRQHPRAIANQLDTLTVGNERLHKDLSTVEREKEKLKGLLRELKASNSQKQKCLDQIAKQNQEEIGKMKVEYQASLSRLEEDCAHKDGQVQSLQAKVADLQYTLSEMGDKHSTEVELLQSRCTALQAEVHSMDQDHYKQISALKRDFQSRDYRPHFEKSQVLVKSLQVELAEYADLAEKMDLAEKLQSDLQKTLSENMRRVQDMAYHLFMRKSDLEVQQAEIMQQKIENAAEAEKCSHEKMEMMEKYEDLKKTLELSRQSILQLQNLYDSTSTDLMNATSQVCFLNQSLGASEKALDEFRKEKEALVEQVTDLEENEKASFLELQSLQSLHSISERELDKTTKRLVELENDLKQQNKILHEKVAIYELALKNIQRTLDSREQDIDILEKDLFECREIIYSQREQMDTKAAEAQKSRSEVQYYEEENSQLRDRCAVLQSKVQELGETLKMTQEELEGTRSHATRIMRQQGTELNDCAEAVNQMTERMNSLLATMKAKVGLQKSGKNKGNELKDSSLCKHESFVSKILQAAVSFQDSVCEDSNSKKCLATSISPSFPGEETSGASWTVCHTVDLQSSTSTNSGSRTVSPLTDSDIGIIGVLESSDASSQVLEAKSEKCGNMTSERQSPSTENQHRLGHSGLSPGTESRQRLGHTGVSAFAPVKSRMHNPDKLSFNSASSDLVTSVVDGNFPEVILAGNIDVSDENYKYSDPPLAEQIAEVADILGEIIRMANIIEKAAQLSIEDLQNGNEDLSQQLAEMEMKESRAQADLELTKGDLTQAQCTIKTLTRSLENLASSRTRLSDQESEIVIQKLQEELMGQRECYDGISSKASRRMRILEDNWKKAEIEVKRFDEMVEVIRQTLLKNKEVTRGNKDFKYLVRLIDGLEELPSHAARKALPPIKSALW